MSKTEKNKKRKKSRVLLISLTILLIATLALLFFVQQEPSFAEVMSSAIAEILPDDGIFEIYPTPLSGYGLGTVFRPKVNDNEDGEESYLWTDADSWWVPELTQQERQVEWQAMVTRKAIPVVELNRSLNRKMSLEAALSFRHLLSKVTGDHEGKDGSVLRMKVDGAYFRQIKGRALVKALKEKKIAADIATLLSGQHYEMVYADIIFESFEAEIEVNSKVASQAGAGAGGSDSTLEGGSLKAKIDRTADGTLKLHSTEPVVVAVKVGRLPVGGLFSDDTEWVHVADDPAFESYLPALIAEADGKSHG